MSCFQLFLQFFLHTDDCVLMTFILCHQSTKHKLEMPEQTLIVPLDEFCFIYLFIYLPLVWETLLQANF